MAREAQRHQRVGVGPTGELLPGMLLSLALMAHLPLAQAPSFVREVPTQSRSLHLVRRPLPPLEVAGALLFTAGYGSFLLGSFSDLAMPRGQVQPGGVLGWLGVMASGPVISPLVMAGIAANTHRGETFGQVPALLYLADAGIQAVGVGLLFAGGRYRLESTVGPNEDQPVSLELKLGAPSSQMGATLALTWP